MVLKLGISICNKVLRFVWLLKFKLVGVWLIIGVVKVVIVSCFRFWLKFVCWFCGVKDVGLSIFSSLCLIVVGCMFWFEIMWLNVWLINLFRLIEEDVFCLLRVINFLFNCIGSGVFVGFWFCGIGINLVISVVLIGLIVSRGWCKLGFFVVKKGVREEIWFVIDVGSFVLIFKWFVVCFVIVFFVFVKDCNWLLFIVCLIVLVVSVGLFFDIVLLILVVMFEVWVGIEFILFIVFVVEVVGGFLVIWVLLMSVVLLLIVGVFINGLRFILSCWNNWISGVDLLKLIGNIGCLLVDFVVVNCILLLIVGKSVFGCCFKGELEVINFD